MLYPGHPRCLSCGFEVGLGQFGSAAHSASSLPLVLGAIGAALLVLAGIVAVVALR